jgi:thiol-disulfide isomerase/thioredoxin
MNIKIVKIGAVWCGACLIMNKVWKQVKENYDFTYIELDYDMDEDEVASYNPGEVLPLFIIYNNEDEVLRITGEYKYDDFINRIKDVVSLNEKDN